MKNSTLWSIVAGTATVAAIAITYKRKDGSSLADGIKDSARNLGDRVSNFTSRIKDRLLHHVKGPNGEPVFIDMYDRQFYENNEGKRVYLELN